MEQLYSMTWTSNYHCHLRSHGQSISLQNLTNFSLNRIQSSGKPTIEMPRRPIRTIRQEERPITPRFDLPKHAIITQRIVSGIRHRVSSNPFIRTSADPRYPVAPESCVRRT